MTGPVECQQRQTVFNIPAKVLKILQDLQLNERVPECRGTTVTALTDNAADVRGT